MRRAMRTSKQLKKEGGLFALGAKTFVPHLTIYMLDFPKKNERKVTATLRKLAKEARPIRFTSLRYRNSGGGYTDVLYKKNRSIIQLQKKIITAINPLREGVIRAKYKTGLASLSKQVKKNIKMFGFSSLGREYKPHLTFTRFAEGRKAILKDLPRQDFSFDANEIGLYHRGKHGTCKKLIAKSRLVKV